MNRHKSADAVVLQPFDARSRLMASWSLPCCEQLPHIGASGNVIGGSLWLAPQSRSFTSSDSPDRRSHHLSEQGIPFPVPPLIGLAWKIQFLAEKGPQPTASTASWLEFLAVADLDGPPSSQLTARSQDLNNSDSSGVA